MVIYGIITEQSIAKLLMAGLLPGLLSAGMFVVGIVLIAKWRHQYCPRPETHFPLRERFASLTHVWGIGLLFGLVIGCIYFGWFTPTYAGAIDTCSASMIFPATRRLRDQGMLDTS